MERFPALTVGLHLPVWVTARSHKLCRFVPVCVSTTEEGNSALLLVRVRLGRRPHLPCPFRWICAPRRIMATTSRMRQLVNRPLLYAPAMHRSRARAAGSGGLAYDRTLLILMCRPGLTAPRTGLIPLEVIGPRAPCACASLFVMMSGSVIFPQMRHSHPSYSQAWSPSKCAVTLNPPHRSQVMGFSIRAFGTDTRADRS